MTFVLWIYQKEPLIMQSLPTMLIVGYQISLVIMKSAGRSILAGGLRCQTFPPPFFFYCCFLIFFYNHYFYFFSLHQTV